MNGRYDAFYPELSPQLVPYPPGVFSHKKLTDKTVLAQVMAGDKKNEVRLAAEERLRKLARQTRPREQ